MTERVINLRGRGARGESYADILRRTGTFGVLPTDSDPQALAKITVDAAAFAAIAEALVGPVYADTTAGLAATASGGYFAVNNGDGTVTIWRDNAGVADMPRSMATTAYLASVAGAGALGFSHASIYSAGTIGEKLQRLAYITDAPYSADVTGAIDCTSDFQDAIDVGNVTFPPGDFTMSGDVLIPGNRKITVMEGAHITNTGGRFIAENVENVIWEIDGWVESVAMATAASKPLWTASVGERGFIEFGSDYSVGQAASGFKVYGSGIVSGDWTGTPNYSDDVNQNNRKGIACWNAKNVLVDGLNVFGFEGEAIYASFFDEASCNIVFQNNYVHDTRFNALNFNAGAHGGGCAIRNNTVKNVYQIETSVGECIGNTVIDTVGSGIYTGGSAGYGPLVIRNNTIINAGAQAGSHGIAVIFGSGTPVTGVEISDNTIVDSYGYSIYTDYIREFTVRGNKCVGTGRVAGSYDIGLNHALRGSVGGNTFMVPGPSAQAGRIAVDPATCFDVSVDPDTNVYMPTTGTVEPYVNNGVVNLASAAALALPALGSIFLITGTTNITSITNAFAPVNGRRITLIFQDALTFTDGSNLKLAGNFVTTADDTITLVSNGANWYEVCRSVN